VAKPQLAVHALGQLGDRSQAGLLPGFGEVLGKNDAAFLAQFSAESVGQLTSPQPVAPHI
jgi:hypothetical protein